MSCQTYSKGNKLKENSSQSHLLTQSGENKHVNLGTSRIKHKGCERLTGIDVDIKLNLLYGIIQLLGNALRGGSWFCDEPLPKIGGEGHKLYCYVTVIKKKRLTKLCNAED